MGVGDGQGGLACCGSWGRKESDTTGQLNWTELDYSRPGTSVHGILLTRILEWVAILFSRGSSQLRYWTHDFCITSVFFTVWATGEAKVKCYLQAISSALFLVNNALSLMQYNYLFLVEFNLNVSKLLSLNIFSFDYNYKLVQQILWNLCW